MALIERTARITWQGTLASGSGSAQLDSGAELKLDEASRTETAQGSTSPEELLAAAHASCYAMALTLVLSHHGHKAEALDVTGTCTLEKREVGFEITHLKLDVSGRVPDLSAEAFEQIAAEADQGCPVSNAVRGNVEIALDVQLES